MFLQKTNKIFKQHVLLIDILTEIQRFINSVIIKQKQNKKFLIKAAFFDIQSVANELYYFQLIILKKPKLKKMYFLENLVSNFLKKISSSNRFQFKNLTNYCRKLVVMTF